MQLLIKSLPNVISCIRCFISLFIFFSSIDLVNIHINYIILLFTLAFLSDALDGYFARYLQACSTLGANLDLLADKMLFFAIWMYIIFNNKNNYIIVFIVALILREIMSVILRWYAKKHNKIIIVQAHGKYKTIYLGFVVILTLVFENKIYELFLMFLWSVGVGISWYSFFKYFTKFISY